MSLLSSLRLLPLTLVMGAVACGDLGLEPYGNPDLAPFDPSGSPEEPGQPGGGAPSSDADEDALPGGGDASSDAAECSQSQFPIGLEQATLDASNPGQPLFAYQARSTENPPFDVLQILSYQGAPYNGPDAPGTYALDGMNYADCGLCLLLLTDCSNDYQFDQVFFIRDGTLDIEAISPSGGPFRAILRDAVFEEVTIDATTYTSTPVEGGDAWCIDELFIDTMIEGG